MKTNLNCLETPAGLRRVPCCTNHTDSNEGNSSTTRAGGTVRVHLFNVHLRNQPFMSRDDRIEDQSLADTQKRLNVCMYVNACLTVR